MKMPWILVVCVSLAISACGGKKAAAPAAPPASGGQHSGDWMAWFSAVQSHVRSGFVVPPAIGPDELKRLSCDVAAQFDENGHLKSASVARSSGDATFDRAALDAVERFVPGTPEKITLPTDPETKRLVLTRPVRFRFQGAPATPEP